MKKKDKAPCQGKEQSLLEQIEDLQARINELESPDTSSCTFASAERSADYLNCLINTIPDLVWLKDQDGVFLSCNEAFEQFYGAREADIVGKTDYDFVGRELADSFRKHDKKAMEADHPSSNEEWITFATTGKVCLVETIKTPMRDDSGALIGILGIARDITARKRTEEALERRLLALTMPMDEDEEVLFENLFNLEDIQKLQDQFSRAMGVAAIITHTDGSPITKPSNFCRLCMDVIRKTDKGRLNCYASDAELGRLNPHGATVRKCLSGGLWDAGAAITVGGRHIANWLIGQVRDESQNEETIRKYAREIGADEEEAAKAFHKVPSMSHERFENVSQMLFTMAHQLSDMAYQNVQQARFIADRKVYEEQLIQLRNQLSDIINSMPSILVGVDGQGRITQWNNEAEKITGFKSKDVLGQALEEVMPHVAGRMERVHEAVQNEGLFKSAFCLQDAKGKTRHKEITVYPLAGERGDGVVIRIDDVTERVNLEQVLVQSEKMMSVGGLAAGMAHEINNPLAIILQGLQNVTRRLSADSETNHKHAEPLGLDLEALQNYMQERGLIKLLGGIRDAGERSAQIVRNMLDFSRVSDKTKSPCDLNELLDSTLEIASTDYNLKKNVDFKKVKITKNYDLNATSVYCLDSELKQVVLNLISNATHAMQGGAPELCITTRMQKDAAVIEVEDNGPGMDEQTRKRIFDPFYTTKGPDQGTGLGLSVSYFIITKKHGGTISVEPSSLGGARFIITLPQSVHGDA